MGSCQVRVMCVCWALFGFSCCAMCCSFLFTIEVCIELGVSEFILPNELSGIQARITTACDIFADNLPDDDDHPDDHNPKKKAKPHTKKPPISHGNVAGFICDGIPKAASPI